MREVVKQRNEKIEEILAENPLISTKNIAKEIGVSDQTVLHYVKSSNSIPAKINLEKMRIFSADHKALPFVIQVCRYANQTNRSISDIKHTDAIYLLPILNPKPSFANRRENMETIKNFAVKLLEVFKKYNCVFTDEQCSRALSVYAPKPKQVKGNSITLDSAYLVPQ